MGKHNTRSNSTSQEEQNLTVDEKLNLLIDEVRQIKLSNNERLSEITKMKEEITMFKKDMIDSLDMCFGKNKDCEEDVKKNSVKITGCETLFDGLKSENIALKKSNGELKEKIVASEQYSRANCLEITGVPEVKGEKIMDLVKQVSVAFNFKLEDIMVDAVHRLAKNPSKPDLPRGIILKFTRRIDMEEMRRRAMVKKRINAMDLGFQSENKIYVNLSLTRETRQLWAQVRKFKEEHDFEFAWITNVGKIFLRRREKQKAVVISGSSDLDCLK